MKNFLLGMFVVVFVASLAAAGYFYLQNKTLTSQPSYSPVTPSPSDPPTPTISLTIQSSTTPTITIKETKAVVVFEGGVSSSGDKNELIKKIVEPYVDYYADQYEPGYLVSFTISENLHPSKTTSPYLGSGVFKNGGNEGFTIDKKDGVINWWAPSCMVCEFSDSYKAKYPEVVKGF